MSQSIRAKLFAVISSLILFFVLLSWVLNTFLLDKYYYYSKKNTLYESCRKISEMYQGNLEDISLELEKLESMKELRVILLSPDFAVKYSLNQNIRDLPAVRREPNNSRTGGRFSLNPFHFLNPNDNDMETQAKMDQLQENGTLIETGRDYRLNTNFIQLFSKLRNGDYIILRASVAAIEESAGIANQFFLFTGLLTILAGSVLVVLITERFTRPVLELNRITKKMSTLDFSSRYAVKSNDELGQLGASINSLSEQLQKSICELKTANEKLKADIEREREIDGMRKEFISNVSHELKTPIALIQGYAEGLKVNVNEDEENKNTYCNIIMDEASKMNRLVKQLLELSQIESGIVCLEKSDFPVIDLVDHVLRKNCKVFDEKNIRLTVEIEADTTGHDMIVHADYDRMEQVLGNYIDNAVHHLDEKKMIRVKVENAGEKARIAVYNSGRPIPEEYLAKVWQSFYKVDKARTRKYGGVGLGLSIVRAIQEAHGNACGVRNIEGGVEFWFEMELAQGEMDATP